MAPSTVVSNSECCKGAQSSGSSGLCSAVSHLTIGRPPLPRVSRASSDVGDASGLCWELLEADGASILTLLGGRPEDRELECCLRAFLGGSTH